jgi:hypothetical protein
MFFVTEVVTPVDCAIKYAVYVTVMLAPGVEVPETVIVYWQGEHVALPLMFNVCAGLVSRLLQVVRWPPPERDGSYER